MKYLPAILLIISVILFACGKENEKQTTTTTDCSTGVKSFATDVNPVIQSSCATNSDCHGSGSINGPGPLMTYTHVSNAKTSIRNAVVTGIMPKTGSLTAAQKAAIICWIDNGGANN